MTDHAGAYDVVIVGGGLAGMVTALTLLDQRRRVLVLDRDSAENFGGLARWALGGLFLVDTPYQRRAGVRDSPELALQDWLRYASFGAEDEWPRRWAEQYVHLCHDAVYRWLRAKGLRFIPFVQWAERGLFEPGNSVPRFHILWGTGRTLVENLAGYLREHACADRLTLRFGHRVAALVEAQGCITGVRGTDRNGAPFEVAAEHVVVAAGGICGDIARLKRHWYPAWGAPPETILNGSHRYADGTLHDAVARAGGNLTHLEKQWLYAAGVHHSEPERRPYDGLSLIPPRSAVWVDYRGQRFGPVPLVGGFDTRYLVEQICQCPVKYSWLILNWKIAVKELTVSGAEHNEAIQSGKLLRMLSKLVRGDEGLVRYLAAHCPDFVAADTLEGLVEQMNTLAEKPDVEEQLLRTSLETYDQAVEKGPRLQADEQLRRLAQVRQYRGDRMRTCKFQKILDPKAGPLIAIRSFIISRKSLGGIQTDLDGRVLRPLSDGRQESIPGLFAVGEAAGFGGGGIHGLRALEGTFLGSCILGGQKAAQAIAKG